MKTTARQLLAALSFMAVIAAFFYLLIAGIQSDYRPSMTMEEIAQADLSETLVPIGPKLCDWYPEALYAPEDFASTAPAPGEEKAMYGTYRMVLPLLLLGAPTVSAA